MKRFLLVAVGFFLGFALQAQNMFWGTSINGGTYNNGALFQFDPTGSAIIKKVDFDSTVTGKNPTGSLVKAIDGKLYGLTINGGTTNQGVLFQYDPFTSVFTKKFDFNGISGGSKPMGQLLQANDGKLYGITTIGGANNKGVLFQFDPLTASFNKKIDFDGTTTGSIPKGSLIQGNDGKLYGMTTTGGVNNKGVIFQYDPVTNVLTKKFDFAGFTNGAEPHGDLLQASDGNLYGLTRLGGTSSKGVLFQYNLSTSTFTKKVDFNGTDKGAEPYGSLIQAADGKLYGMTEDGGASNIGVIFQYDPITSSYTKKLNFNGNDTGSKPSGSFVLASDGKYYATTSEGGVNSNGVLFQYDFTTFSYTKKSDFSAITTGQRPVNIIEAPVNVITTSAVSALNCSGSTINVAYTALGVFNPGNVFTAELSDASGSFGAAVSIGTFAATTSGTINAIIPDITPAGTSYRIRVISSNPAIAGSNNGSNITINSTPAQLGTFITSSSSVNRGQSGVTYAVPNDPSVTTYNWSYSGAGATINGSGNSITIDFSLSATGGLLSVTASANGCTSPSRTLVISIGTTGPSSSQSPYLLNVTPNALYTSMLTAGDVVGAYKMCGTPDGMGAYDNNNGTFTILMNHEFGNTAGVARAHGSKGAFVSKWIVNKSNLAIVSGADLIQNVKLWNGSGYTTYNSSTPSALTAFNRFCSADLPAPAAFYNSATGLGTQEKIFMNGEESGNEGRAFAHIATGTEAGTTYELPYLGKLSWENSVACPFTGNKTLVAGLDDSTPGQVYFYIGTKTNSGTDIDKAGLNNGKLFGIAVTGLATETNASIPATNSPFTLADLGQVQNLTGAVINTNSNNLGVTTFLRPEDGAWDPAHPGDFYFNTTNAFNSPSRLWKVHFTDINNPELGGTITAVLDGTEGQQMLDNLTIDNSGHILLVEDVGGNAHLGKVWQYTIATDELKQVGTHDPTRFLTGAPNFLTQDEEASGILDVQSILGPGMFIVDVQAHYGVAGEVVEGGQLLAYYNPDSYASNPEITVKGNNVNITDGDITPSITDSTHVGIVTIGQSSIRSYTIQNAGTGDLIVASVNFSGANASEFTLVGTAPAIIAAGTFANIAVKFTPAVIGNRTATLTINNNDLDESIFDFALSGTATDQPTAPSSSQSPYLLPVAAAPGAQYKSILTAGDITGGYKMCGTPDGLGAFDNGNGTFTILMNHEFGNTAGIARAHGSKGAFVSKWVVNKSNLAIVSGSDLIQNVKLWNGSGYTTYNASTPSALTAFNRFCSADLPAPAAFYNSATGLGTQEKIFMNGEESGNEGRAFAHIATGTESGTTYELPYLGKLSWENSVACPFTGNKTLVAGLDDSTPGQVYFYIGTKTNSGSDIDKAGLNNGKLFGIAVTGLATETNGSVPAPNSPFTLADLGQVQNLTGAVINTNSNNLGVTTFLRPEDGAWDPAHPGDFYFNTTNAFNSPSRLWKVHFTDINNPELGGTITAVLDGTEGQQMLDNLTIDNSGHVLLVEDVGNNAHIGKVWQYTIATDELKQVGIHDPSRFVNGAPNFLTQDEEASGILDVQSILGPGMFIVDVQAHYGVAGEVVEGGQLLVYYNPDSYASNPEIAVKGNNVNIIDGDVTPAVTDSTHVGIATVGQPRTTYYIVQNAGTGSLLISSVNFSGVNAAEFSLVNPAPVSIAGGASATIAVKFNPTAIGTRTANIQINNNDLDESVFDFAISGTATDQPTAPSSSQSPYLLPVATTPGAQYTAMLTAGDVVGAYKMCGTPDGMGAYDNNNGTFTILMNHEFGNTAGVARAHGSKGAFVSKWVVNKNNLSIVSGADLIQNVKLWNGSGYTTYNASTPSALTAFNRFCSADLPAPAAFYNSATGLGTQEKIFMNGEEAGNEGRAFAHIATGTEAGTTYELPYLGKLSWENSVACPFTGNKTLVAGLDDSTPGQVYFYIGTKTNSGTDIDKAGLNNGKLFGIAVSGFATETNASIPATNSPFTLADLGQVQNLTGAVINTNSNNLGVTTFLRPEDGAWDPAHPGDFYFNTTNAFNSPSRLWKVHFTDINNPELGGTITAVLDGTEGQQMLDNLTIDNSGHILLVEDVGGNAHLGKVWQYTIATDELKQVGTHDPTRFLTGAPNFLTQDEEASGILDVQSILGPGMFIVDVQAHYSIAGEVVEGGQLLAYYNPDSYNAAPLVYNVTGGGAYCANDTIGVAVGVSNSQSGVNYQLIRNDSLTVGTPVSGTGSAISFGNKTATGTYKIIATSTVNNSSTTMAGSVTISIHSIPTVSATVEGDTNICAADSVLLTAAGGGAGSTYLWSNGAATQSTFVHTDGNYSVVLTDVNGCSSASSSPVVITTYSVPEDFSHDGIVNTPDLNLLLLQFGSDCTCSLDLNHDGKVTIADLNQLLLVFGNTCLPVTP